MDCDCGSTGTMIWKEADTLPPRVKRLRDEYFSFYERDYFRNEALGFSTGAQWDVLWRSYNWGINPEIFPFFAAIEDSLLASAVIVKTPESFWKLPLVRRRSLFFSEVLRKHLPAQILEGELIVGAQFNNAMSLCLNKAEAKGFRAAQKKWWDAAQVLNDTGVGNCGAVPGHLIPNYKKAVEIGFAGYAEEIKAELRKQPDERKRAQLQAMLECCEAVPDFTSRYAAEAERLAAAEGDAARRAELAEIARVCRKVPWNPPETFAESLQAVWFTHMLAMFSESYPGPGVSHGRIDQYLFPLYKKSVEQGMTREQARELLMCFWIKHNYAYDFMGRVGANQGINSGFGQLVTLSGCGPDGSDLTNELTMLMLDVIEEINMLEPKPNVRLHRNSPPELVERVGGMLSKAQGAPVLLNFDEASMRGLKWQGMPEGELWDYAPVGCLENAFQGCDRSGTVDVNLNLAKAVELTLNDGCDLATGRRIGPKTGDPAAFDSFDKFYAAFNAQLDALLDVICECVETADFVRSKYEFIPYLSVLVDGCMENGRDINEGGAKYNYITVEGIAFGTTVDSVAAVKKVVFEEGRVSMPDLVAAIKANYEGHEKTRQFMMNRAPKYGTDDNEADALAAEINKRWTERAFARVSPHTGKRFRGGYLSWNYWIAYAPFTAATPDGRKRGSFLSNGIGPVNGMDRKGPTANIRSVGKVGLESAPNGASHTISVSPSLLRDPEHVTKLSSMLRAYALEGGTALQVNVLDPDTLRRAQKNPEEYRNLLVRVTGYNAYFVNLGREIQDEIIAREAGVL